MNRVLVDVNVVLDVLLALAPHAAASTACLAAIEAHRVEGFLSGHAVTTLAYLVGRARGRAEARKVVQDLCALFSIAPVGAAVLQRAMVLPLDDFEDAVTAAAAEAAGCEAILTRDVSGFADSPVPGVEPQLWLALLEEGGKTFPSRKCTSRERRVSREGRSGPGEGGRDKRRSVRGRRASENRLAPTRSRPRKPPATALADPPNSTLTCACRGDALCYVLSTRRSGHCVAPGQ